ARVGIDHVLLHTMFLSIVEHVKSHRAILHGRIQFDRHLSGTEFYLTFPDSSRCHKNLLLSPHRNNRNNVVRVPQFPVRILDKRCSHNRYSKSPLDTHTIAGTSNKFRCLPQTTTTEQCFSWQKI